ADHATAKATLCALGACGESRWVRRPACVQGPAENTEGPSVQPKSRPGGSYKPEGEVERRTAECDGTTVPKKGRKLPERTTTREHRSREADEAPRAAHFGSTGAEAA